jgi:hypothetical protein
MMNYMDSYGRRNNDRDLNLAILSELALTRRENLGLIKASAMTPCLSDPLPKSVWNNNGYIAQFHNL